MTARICICRTSVQCGVNDVARGERPVSILFGSVSAGVGVQRASFSDNIWTYFTCFLVKSRVVMRTMTVGTCAVTVV